jgi:acyl-CoA synthetase (AMP-forming)/AMP-acid ligase II
METLNEALERAAGFPNCGLRILDRRQRETWLSWAEVRRNAARVAGGLRAQGVKRGQTVGLLYPTGEEFFAAFFGVLLAGGVPVPLYPPVRLGRLAEYHKGTARMLRAAGIELALTDSALRRILGEPLHKAGCRGRTLRELPAVEELAESADPDNLGLVQFSSGTTVEPKPVALTHRAVMAQTTILNSLWPDTPDQRHTGVSWLPLYHDMGLIGCVFTVLERPSVLTLIPPEVFVARPATWLQALSKYQATISPAPNFAFGLCVEKIREEDLHGVDLSSWLVALCGAETVVPAVLRAFSDRFSRWGFRPRALTPVYGLSEAALAVTFSAIDKPFSSRPLLHRSGAADGGALGSETTTGENSRELVSVGRPLPRFEIEIRSEKGEVLPEGEVGRIWARGPSLMKEYLNQQRATQECLRGGWLDTGDLGFVQEDELYITGRAKEVLIIRGSNRAPEEIEVVASDLDGVRTGCVAAVGHLPGGSDREQVWLFVERHSENEQGDQELQGRCRQGILAQTGIAVDRIEILEAGTLPRTSSGKIRRQKALELFLGGNLHPPEPVTASGLLQAMGRSALARMKRRQKQNDDG